MPRIVIEQGGELEEDPESGMARGEGGSRLTRSLKIRKTGKRSNWEDTTDYTKCKKQKVDYPEELVKERPIGGKKRDTINVRRSNQRSVRKKMSKT